MDSPQTPRNLFPAAEDDEEEPQAGSVSRWMACTYRAGTLGVAVWDADTNKLQALQVPDSNKGPTPYQTLQQLRLQTAPDVICLSSSSEQQLQEACREVLAGLPSSQQTAVQLERPSLFSHARAYGSLSRLRVMGMAPAAGEQQHLAALSECIDLQQPLLVSALGALVSVLLQQRASEQAEGTGGWDADALVVSELSELQLKGHLVVDGPTLAALGVFKEERHPSNMGIGVAKEGFSLFGLLNRCVSQMGKRLLHTWFLRPMASLRVLTERHDAIDVMMAAAEATRALQAALKKVPDIPRLLQRLQLMQAKPDAACFKQLSEGLAALFQLRQQVQGLAPGALLQQRLPWEVADAPAQDIPFAGSWLGQEPMAPGGASPWDDLVICRQLLTAITDDLLGCTQLIQDVLDWEQAAEGWMVQYGVCHQLDQLKQLYLALPDLLTEVVEAELQRIPAHIARRYNQQLWSIVYMPQVGYVMQVTGAQLSPELLELLPDYQLAFSGDQGTMPAGVGDPAGGYSAFYYAQCTQQLNQQYGDILYKVQDLETSICTELIRRLLAYAPPLHAASAAVAELDCLLSLATTAREHNYVRPELTTDTVLDIQEGRHPLAELLVEGSYIPNDTTMAQGKPSVHVITGPNASGKSCYTKQVGLIVYMAHIGSFVPAQRAVVGLTDRILTRIITQDQLAARQSSFMADLLQVTTCLRKATSRSLVILDEFGKGTLTSDGVGLLAAILEHFATQMSPPPRVLACTHFTELLQPEVLPRHAAIGFYTMSVLLPDGSSLGGGEEGPGAGGVEGGGGGGAAAALAAGLDLQALDKHVFLYKLVAGHVAPSFGVLCAAACGVDTSILQRAAQVIELQQAGLPVPRLRLPQLEERLDQQQKIVRELAACDLSKQAEVWKMLQRVAAAAAAGD